MHFFTCEVMVVVVLLLLDFSVANSVISLLASFSCTQPVPGKFPRNKTTWRIILLLMEQIMHQLIGGVLNKHPKVVQDFY